MAHQQRLRLEATLLVSAAPCQGWQPNRARTPDRFSRLIGLRQEALETGYAVYADRLLSLDTDVFLINSQTLSLLVEQVSSLPLRPNASSMQAAPIVAPLIHSFKCLSPGQH